MSKANIVVADGGAGERGQNSSTIRDNDIVDDDDDDDIDDLYADLLEPDNVAKIDEVRARAIRTT